MLPQQQCDPDPEPSEVTLRPAMPRDAELLCFWRSEPAVRRFQPLNDLPSSQLRSDLAHQRISDLYKSRGDKYQWIIELAGQPAGWITLVIGNWEHGLAEVGYALSTPFQRRGIMKRAITLLVDELFATTAIERVEARCALENVGSQRVLESVGFAREGLLRSYFRLRGKRVDNYLYARLKPQTGS